MKLSIYIRLIVFFSLAIFMLLPLYAFAQNDGIITTQEEFIEAVGGAKAGDTILVGDIEFKNDTPMGITISKGITIKSGKADKAVFSDGAFAIMGSAKDEDRVDIRFENIVFSGENDVDIIDITGDFNIMRDTKIHPAVFFSRNVDAAFAGCEFSGYSMMQGGAVYGIYSSNDSMGYALELELEDCVLSDNIATYGGALYLSGADNISLKLKDCTVKSNIADFGGGIYASCTDVYMKNCTLSQNHAEEGAGAAFDDCEVSLEGCVIEGNNAERTGGGFWVRNTGNTPVIVVNSTLSGNSALEGGAVYINKNDTPMGGGIGKTYLVLSTIANDQQFEDCGEEFIDVFGCAIYGAAIDEMPSEGNNFCLYSKAGAQSTLGHILSGVAIDDAFLDNVLGGRFSNRAGQFFAGDNSFDEMSVVFDTGIIKERTAFGFGEEISLPEVKKNGFDLIGWELKNGYSFETEYLYIGAGTDELTVKAIWKWNGSANSMIALLAISVLVAVAGVFVAVKKSSTKNEAAIADESVEAAVEEKSSRSWDEWDLLTPREKDVVKLLLEGKQRKQIAAELFITEHTVKDHVSNSYRKLGVKNKSELFAKANSFEK